MYVCTICARGGSKGVPGKNIRPLMGLPLIAYSIQQARATGLFSLIVVSSDSDDILTLAKHHGADLVIKRPDAMATDAAGKMPAIAHAVAAAETFAATHYKICVDLSVTAPLRLPEDIIAAVELQKKYDCKSIITGAASHCSPYFSMVEKDKNGIVHVSKISPAQVLRRQDSPPCYDMNGSIYVWKRDALLADPKVFYDDTRIHIMPRERSFDIDEELDFQLVEFMMQRNNA